MTSAFLQTELASLIQDSKRKHSDVRSAAEKSLSDLKAISVTSEAQLAADLLRKSQFIDPFVLACNSKQTKLAVTGAVCLQRLVASKAIPRGRLSGVVDAFQEASQQGYDVQLKVLQALPSLLQLYSSELQGDPLAKVLSLCGGLASSRTGLVSSTAGATFQQLIASVFQRVADESRTQDTGETASGIAVSDASKVFCDMCMVVKSEKPQFLHLQDISLQLALEVIENCLSSEDLDILSLPDCMTICETHLVPGVAAVVEKSNNYGVFSQCLRVTHLLSTSHLADLSTALTDVFNVVLDQLDRGAMGSWRRVLCLELMRDISSDFDAFRLLYRLFDQTEGRHNIVQDLMGTLVRIASEDPALIGLGRQSTVPTNTNEGTSNIQNAIEMSDFDAIGSVMQAGSSVTGISTKWSTTATPFLEQIDRKQPPEIPETYIYTLVLACAAAFSEGLSKFVMPLAVPSRAIARANATEDADGDTESTGRRNSQRAQKYQRLQNPLKRDDLYKMDEIKLCAAMVEDCWPAVLATCSTFLNSALDSYFYHILVRTVQKLAQVSGVMELLTPRDALLTTLAKVSVPINASSIVAMLYGTKHAKRTVRDNDLSDEEDSIKSPVQSTPKPSIDITRQNLNIRNLLCLRALLNLGIALGPTLSSSSWFIIIQTLQQVEALMSVSPTAKSAQGPLNSHPTQTDGEGQTTLSTEVAAVGTASKRMIESTRTYTDASFEIFTKSVFKVIDGLVLPTTNGTDDRKEESGKQLLPTPPTGVSHKSSRSVSSGFPQSGVLSVEVEFVLKTISDLSRVNLYRFVSRRSQLISWNLIVFRLLQFIGVRDIEPTLRLQAATIVDQISIESVRLLEKQDLEKDDLDILQQACLDALSKQSELLYRGYKVQQDVIAAEVDIHRRLLDALEDIVSHSGESLRQGWRIVFNILQLTVKKESPVLIVQNTASQQHIDQQIMARTLPVAFRTVQLIVADFLESIDAESLWVLVQLLPLFGMQKNDLNISLTTTTLFWNINSLVLDRVQSLHVPSTTLSKGGPLSSMQSAVYSEGSTLWFATMMHLAELSEDTRIDVRNGAIRVLLKIFEASSEQLTPEMWNLSIQKVLLLPLRAYNVDTLNPKEHLASFSQLLSGTTDLIVQHLSSIGKGANFTETWSQLISVYDGMLERRSASGHIAVFESANTLVQSLGSAGTETTKLLHQLLQLWLRHHPADVVETEDSSSLEFTKHAQLIKEIDRCNPDAISTSTSDHNSLHLQIMQSTKRSILSAVQDKYSNDVKKLSPEQTAVVANLDILSRLMAKSQHEYSKFLQELIIEILVRHEKAAANDHDTSRKPRPSFIAFMATCVDLLRSKIPTIATNRRWLDDLDAESTLGVLARSIRTKYTAMPVNDASPAWQQASTVATELFQAIKLHTKPVTKLDVESLSHVTVDLAEAILNAPALEQNPRTNIPPSVLADEAFDISCFSDFHKAVTPLLERSDFPEPERKRYVLVLFNVSLIARPWFGDLPPDQQGKPLEGLNILRSGSIRIPDFYIRKQIPYEANQALLDLVARHDEANDTSKQDHTDKLALAKTAAPYILLRLAHTMKSFLADQRLRYLNPPPRPIQRELNLILNSALKLSCLDEAFVNISAIAASSTDGKTHLRLLYPLVMRTRDFWSALPRLGAAAWQDDDDGRDIETALQSWTQSICEAWSADE